MTLKQQEEHLKMVFEIIKETMIKKGNDYSQEDTDRLSNFKLAGAITGMSGSKQCLSLIATKVARLGALLDNKVPNNESIGDSILDLINYAILLGMLESERNV